MKIKQKISLQFENHRNEKVVALRFKYDKVLIEKVKKVNGVRWSQSRKFWYINNKDFKLSLIFDTFRGTAFIDYSALKNKSLKKKSVASEVEIPQSYYDNLEQRRYSKNTKAIYTSYFKDFVNHFKDRVLDDIEVKEINSYILQLIREKNISTSQQNQRINAIKFYYEKVLGRNKMYIDVKRPIKKKLMPNVLSVEEIKRMIDVTENIKHKCIISLLYSAGLRRSELINLKISDILSGQMLIKVSQSKGNKDRYVGLSSHMLDLLRSYYRKYRPKFYIIEGKKGERYSPESVLKVVKTAAKKAKINRNVTPHMLRHSFATHHLESGTDLRYIQEFLGHNSSKTTEIYTHVANTDFTKFTNPLDKMYKKNDKKK